MDTQLLRNKLLHAFSEQSSDAMIVSDFHGHFLDVNQQACLMLGYSRDELLKMTISDIYPEFNLGRSQAAWNKIQPLEKQVLYGRHRRKDGSFFPVEIQCGCVEHNNQRHYLALVRDISNIQNVVERAVLHERNHLNNILNSIVANIAVLDADGTITMVNEGWRRFKTENQGDSKPADDVGSNYLQVCDESIARDDDPSLVCIRDGIQSVLDGSRQQFDYEYPCHSLDKQRWFNMSASLLTDCSGGCVIVHTDITQRKLIEDALLESEERMRLAFLATQDGIWDVKIDSNEAFYSTRWKSMLGYEESEISPDLDSWKRLLHPDDLPRVMRTVQDVIEGKNEYAVEFRMLHRDGHYVEILSRGIPIYRSPGRQLVRVVGTHFDLTEQKQAEEALCRANRELEETNTAMKVLLAHLEDEKIKQHETIHATIRQLVMPYLAKIRAKNDPEVHILLEIASTNLEKIVSPLLSSHHFKIGKLSPQELLVANLVQEGKKDKEIAALLNSSIHTIKAHRRNIRKKLGLAGKKENLKSYLTLKSNS